MDWLCCLCVLLCPPPKKKLYEEVKDEKPITKRKSNENHGLLSALALCSPISPDLGLSYDESYTDEIDINIKRKNEATPGTYTADFSPYVPPTPMTQNGLDEHMFDRNNSGNPMSPSSDRSGDGSFSDLSPDISNFVYDRNNENRSIDNREEFYRIPEVVEVT